MIAAYVQIALLLVAGCLQVAAEADDASVILTDKNFKDLVKTDAKSDAVWFIEFYAPWCGACKATAPHWAKLAEHFKDDKNIKIAKVDATVEKELAGRWSVNSYPTILTLHKGSYYQFKTKRTLEDMRDYLVEKQYLKGDAQPIPGSDIHDDSVILTDENFNKLVDSQEEKSDSVWFVEFYAPWCGACKAAAPHWAKLSTHFKDDKHIKIGKLDATIHKNTASRWGVNGYPTILLIHKGRYLDYKKTRTLEEMKSFLTEAKYKGEKTQAVPPTDYKNAKEDEQEEDSDVVVLKDDNFESQVAMGFKGAWFIEFYAVWCGHCRQLKPVWELLATKLKPDGIKVAKIEANKNKQVSDRFGVNGFPTLYLIKDGHYYEHSGGRTLQALVDFAHEGYKNVTPGPIAMDFSGGSTVKVLDDANFEHDTQAASGATTGDWFVEFGAAECKPCQNLRPAWEYAARELKGKVNFAYVEALENPLTAARFSVRSYPKLLLFSKGKMYFYNDSREVAALKEFAQKKGVVFENTNGLNVPKELSLVDSIPVRLERMIYEWYKMWKYNTALALVLILTGLVIGAISACVIGNTFGRRLTGRQADAKLKRS